MGSSNGSGPAAAAPTAEQGVDLTAAQDAVRALLVALGR